MSKFISLEGLSRFLLKCKEIFYQKPAAGIPASDIEEGVIPDISGKQDKWANVNVADNAIVLAPTESGGALILVDDEQVVGLGYMHNDENDELACAHMISAAPDGVKIQSFDDYGYKSIDFNGNGVDMNNTPIAGLPTPTDSDEAATKGYVDSAIPASLSQLSADSTHRLVTDTEKSTWNAKYTKPSTGIPASDLAAGVIPSVPVTDVTVGGTSVVSGGTAVIPAIPDVIPPLFPDFDKATPIQTIEFDRSSSTYFNIFERTNTGITASDLVEKAAFRITVTGTDIYQVVDVLWVERGSLTPDVYAYNKTISVTAATTGVYALRAAYPAAVGNDVSWMLCSYAYNSTARHIKIEVFETSPSFTWLTTPTNIATTGRTASYTYLTVQGVRSLYAQSIDVSSATKAQYLTNYLNPFPNTAILTAGGALAAGDLCFRSANDGKVYPASNTTEPVNVNEFVLRAGTAYTANASIAAAYIQVICTDGIVPTSLTLPTFAKGDNLYLRFSISNGNIYSDGVIATTPTAGYTWYHIGTATSAARFCFHAEGRFFFTLDSNGKLTHINGKEILQPDLSVYALATGDNSYDFAANSIRLVYEPQPGTTVNVPLTFALGRLHVSIPSGGALNTNKSVAFTDDIPTVPTISTNVVTDKASDTKTSSPKSVYDEIHPATQSSQPAGGFLPNVVYNLGTLSGNTTFALATPADSSVANHYYWTFDTGSTAPTITWPASITGWNGGSAPTINASKHYEISVLNGVGAFMEV